MGTSVTSEAIEPRTVLTRHWPPEDCIEDGIWIRLNLRQLPPVRAGWKLHIASVPVEYVALLSQIAPLLQRANCAFKCVRDIDTLAELNDGVYGLPQVGKALTIYAGDEQSALTLALQLRPLLGSFSGPDIPSDFRIFPNVPLFGRFGPFDGRFAIDAMGRRQRILAHPDLGDVLDSAEPGAPPPISPTLLPHLPPSDHLAPFREDFLVVSMLRLSAKGGTFLAIDRADTQKRVLVLKSGRCGAASDRWGRDGRWGLRREYTILQALDGAEGAPYTNVYMQETTQTAILIRPYIPGKTLYELWLQPDARTPRAREHLLRLLDRLEQLIQGIHARGFVVRDLSPSNVLYDGKQLWILDFELAHQIDDPSPPFRRGTRGFYDPSKPPGEPPAFADDFHALDALRAMVEHGVHPGWWRNGRLPSFLLSGRRESSAIDSRRRPDLPDPETVLRAELERLLDAHADDVDAGNLYSGIAGVLATAAEMGPTEAFRVWLLHRADSVAAMLQRTARLLAHIPGLYFGAPGVALGMLALQELVGADTVPNGIRHTLLDMEARDAQIPDLCQGQAGYLLALIAAHARTKNDAYLKKATQTAKILADLQHHPGEWPWPDGPYGSLRGSSLFGFAHGVAGIVYAFLSLHDLDREAQWLEIAGQGLRWLLQNGRTTEEGNLRWPVAKTDDAFWNAWCHGSPGITLALLKARQNGLQVDARVFRAALHGIAAANSGGFCLCHGVASRLNAYVTVKESWPELIDDTINAAMAQDAATLESLDWVHLHQTTAPQEPPASGLMTGATGIIRTLLRHRAFIPAARLWLP